MSFRGGSTWIKKRNFNLYQEEHEKAKQHFHQIRLEIALKTSELVNAVFRRMNDCALSVESYESRFEQTFIDVTQEYQMKEEQMKNLKKTCLDIANNDPLPQLSNFISGSFSQTSVEMSVFTNKIVNSIREFSALPKFILDTGPVINILNNTAKFSIQGQIVHPLYRTDPTLKLIDVPISKLAENPISELSANRKQGEKRPGGPYFDAFEAKKIRSEESEFSASEIAGTKIIHPSKADFIPITPSPPVQTPIPIIPYQSRNTFPTILKEKPQSSQQQQQQQRLPIIAPKLPSVAHGFRGGAPIITFRPRGNLQYQIPSSSAFSTYNPPQYQRLDGLQQNVIPANQILPLSYNNQVINRFGNQGIQQAIRNFPHYLQIRPRPLTRVINASSNNGNGNMNNYNRGSHIQNANNSNQGTSNQDVPRLPRVPVVPHLKKGSDSMQKALMDIIVQPGGRVVRQRLTSKSSDKPASNSTSSKRNKKSSESISHQQEEEEEEETNETNGKLRRSARLSKHK
uniref:Retrotransposon gag domain-containing protein n=1 Tax=Panagrolaimus superbus TaxID=310955 RepID=A0A914XQG8_9BILA